MKKTLLFLILLAASIGNYSFGQYCIPAYTTGTSDGDFIESVYSGSWANMNTGYAGGPNYNDYTWFTSVGITQGQTYLLNIVAGSYSAGGDYYAVWIDFNGDGDFYDSGEKVGEVSNSTAYQTLSINSIYVPTNSVTGLTRMRVRCVFNTANMDPCATYTYGETEDYSVNIAGGGYCLPTYTNGTNSGDFIDDVVLNTLSNTNSGYTGGPNYNDYTSLYTNINQGSFYSITLGSGAASGNTYAVWIDYNQDGDLNDAGEKLGETAISGSYSTGTVSFTTSGVSLTGFTLMRVRCAWSSTNLDPCANYSYGETEDYAVNILPPVSGGYCTTALNPACSSDYITDVTIQGTTLINPNNTCNTTGGAAYSYYTLGGGPTCNLTRGQNYTLQVTTNSNDIISVWIDLNQDNVFASNEWAQVTTSSIAYVTSSIVIGIPSGAALGQTRMRVRSRLSGNSNGSADACTGFGSGETEDYLINIVNPTGAPPVADFLASWDGSAMDFTDYSLNTPTSWFWQFQGGSPSTSTSQNPANISYSSPGCYNVTLTVTNAWGSDTYTAYCYISVPHPTACTELFISEYLEGSSSNKALELFNPTNSSISLSNYSIYTYSNGSTTPTYTQNLNGVLGPYQNYVLTDPSATLPGITSNSDLMSTVCYFDGNDVVCLLKNGIVIDKIGDNIGIDPGIPFTIGSYSMGEQTLVRNASVDRPSTYWPDAPGEWTGYSQNTTSFLGVHTSTCAPTGLPPVAAFVGSPLNITVGQSVNFTDLSTNSPTSWSWTFTGGSPANSFAQNPNGIVYNTPGCYQVQLTATNAFGFNTATQVCYVNVTQPGSAPVANFSASNTSICAGSCVNFTDLSLNSPTTWSWSFPGANSTSSTSQNPTNICYNTPGQYNVTLTVSNAFGNNSITQQMFINVYANPTANAGAPVTICPGQSTNLNASGGTTYQWNPTVGLSDPNISNPVANPTTTTTYTVVVSNGPCSSVASVTVTVSPLNAAAGNDVSICQGGNIQLNASGGNSYSWFPTTGLSNPGIANPLAFPTSTTTYTVTVSNGFCSATDDITITVQNPSISAGNDQTICVGDSAWVSVLGGAQTLNWTPTSGLSNPSGQAGWAYPTSTTTYTINATVNGCPATDQITINVNPLPTAPVISMIGNDLSSTSASFYQWYFAGAPIAGATYQTYFPTQIGDYTVLITDANGCQNISAPYTVLTVGMNEVSQSGVNMYPNPVADFLYLQYESNATPKVEVLNSLGQVVMTVPVTSRKARISIDVTSFEGGVYFIRMSGSEGLTTKRFIKN